MNHIIKQQVIEVMIEDQAIARELQDELSYVYQRKVVPYMSKICDEFDVEDKIIRIDQIDIDIGNIPFEKIREEFPDRVWKAFEEQIRMRVFNATAEDTGIYPEDRTISQGHSDLEVLVHFLRFGAFVWNTSERPPSLKMLFSKLLVNHPGELKKALAIELKNQRARKRIIYQFDEETIRRMLSLLCTLTEGMIQNLAHDYETVLQNIESGAKEIAKPRESLWDCLMEWSLSRPRGPSLNTDDIESFNRILTNHLSWKKEQSAQENSTDATALEQILLEKAAEGYYFQTRALNRWVSLKTETMSDEVFSAKDPLITEGEAVTEVSVGDQQTKEEDSFNDLIDQAGNSEEAEDSERSDFPDSQEGPQTQDHGTGSKDALPESSLIPDHEKSTNESDKGSTGITTGIESVLPKEVDPLERYDDNQTEAHHDITSDQTTNEPEFENKTESVQDQSIPTPSDQAHTPRDTDASIVEEEAEKADHGEEIERQHEKSITNDTTEGQFTSDEHSASRSSESDQLTGSASPEKRANTEEDKVKETSQAAIGPGKEEVAEDHQSFDIKEKIKKSARSESFRSEDEQRTISRPDVGKEAPEYEDLPSQSKDSENKQDAREVDWPIEKGQDKNAESTGIVSKGKGSESSLDKPSQSTTQEATLPQEKSKEEDPSQLQKTSKTTESGAQEKAENQSSQSEEQPDSEHSSIATDPTIHSETALEASAPAEESNSIANQSRWLNKPAGVLDEAYIDNAGLVLLWPYLPTLFKGMQWMEDDKFLSEELQFRAIHFLQFLVTGDEPYEEPALALNKLLCGLAIEDPVPSKMAFSEEEEAEAINLLEVVLKHWEVMKGTSVHGLQEAFLQKQGVLKKELNGWKLLIERSTIDILLEKLPWSYNVIKLPWLDQIIYVEW